MSVHEAQSAQSVLMVRPESFAFNPQTAPTNAFQHRPQAGVPLLQAAQREFDAAATALAKAGIRVFAAPDTAQPPKPDAIFPNNWVSFHADGTVVLYPMLAVNRRLERRDDLIADLVRDGGFQVSRTIDLSAHEARGQYLEGTGSLVLDRRAHVAYACQSPRTDLAALGDFAQQLDYEPLTFEAADAAGQPVYHTNVLMAVGSRFAVVCAAAISQPAQRAAVLARLAGTGHEVIEISLAQMQAFAGNLLELASAAGPLIALSTTAWQALDPAQRAGLERHARIVCVDIPTIEQAGGGGIRCMLAEVHLPGRVHAS
jgi:hypothetical protein